MVTSEPHHDDTLIHASHTQSPQRILLMEDDPALRRLYQVMLSILGYDPVCVAEGRAALAAYDNAHRDGFPFPVVILDLHNTRGPGGLSTLAALRAREPQVKAVVSSVAHHDPVLRHFHDYGFCAALKKPWGLQQLRDTLQRLVSSQGRLA
jgi:CheY-like chemotaxis protein